MTKAVVIGITGSEFDHVIHDSEVNLPGYNILQCDRNRNDSDVACYIKNDLCFNTKTLGSKEIEILFLTFF